MKMWMEPGITQIRSQDMKKLKIMLPFGKE